MKDGFFARPDTLTLSLNPYLKSQQFSSSFHTVMALGDVEACSRSSLLSW